MKLIAWHHIIISTGQTAHTEEFDSTGAPIFRPVSREVVRGEEFEMDDEEAKGMLADGAAFRADDPSNEDRFGGLGK